MAYLLNYSRYPVSSKLYDPRLAYSMHLALSEDGKTFEALNHNSGVLFGLATENEDGSLNPKCLKSTCLFALKEGGQKSLRLVTRQNIQSRKNTDKNKTDIGRSWNQHDTHIKFYEF